MRQTNFIKYSSQTYPTKKYLTLGNDTKQYTVRKTNTRYFQNEKQKAHQDTHNLIFDVSRILFKKWSISVYASISFMHGRDYVKRKDRTLRSSTG